MGKNRCIKFGPVLTYVRITHLDYIQYNAVLVFIGVIRDTSKTKLYNELSSDSLSNLEDV